jgi:hypothetical protein
MANELPAGAAWVMRRLTANPTLDALLGRRIFADYAPQSDPQASAPAALRYPLLIFSVAKAHDAIKGGGQRALTVLKATVKVVGEGGGYGDLTRINDAVDSALHHASPEEIAIGSEVYSILGCYRETPIMYPHDDEGVRYNYLGGEYCIYVKRKT